jgi:MFS family permease
MTTAAARTVIETDIPAQLDRLPWGRFHWLLVCALGVTWVLDGLEVTVVGAVGNALLEPGTLGLRQHQLGLAQTGYLVGAITGALFFGHLTDRLGRKRLFTVTLLVYLAGAAFTALSGTSGASRPPDWSPAWRSAGSTRRSTRRSTNSSRPGSAVVSIWR